jgi:hypothetical protein
MKDNNDVFQISTVYMPGSTPAPYVLTSDEAIKFLRIDTNGTKHPEATLEHYQQAGLLFPVTIGKCRKYPLPELLRFIDRLSQLKENTS